MEFQFLIKLQRFYVFLNSLTGEIPFYLGNFSSLKSLSLGGNNFHGRIPDVFSGLKNLELLELGQNNLSGTVPSSIFNLSSLQMLQLEFNQLEGQFPSDIAFTLPRLVRVNLVDNRLTGRLPPSISNATKIKFLAVDNNDLTGNVPFLGSLNDLYWLGPSVNHFGKGKLEDLSFMSSLQNCTALKYLLLQNNNFGGILPSYMGNLSNLLWFTIGGNLIHGKIPMDIYLLTNLRVLGYEYNRLTGSIPESLGKLIQLNVLSLNNNQFSGVIPSSLGNLTRLTQLSLGSNALNGTLPSSLGHCKFLLRMTIRRNNLRGHIPSEYFRSLQALLDLDLSKNQITGPSPIDISMKNLYYLSLSHNNLSGEVPSNFDRLTGLRELYLDYNVLQGTIPPSLSSLKSLESLDLSHNNFVGKIPEFFSKLSSLKYLNLSHNNLDGEIPMEGVFTNKSQVSIDGNKQLCGGVPELKMPKCTQISTSRRSHVSRTLILATSIPGGIVALTAVMFLLYWLIKRKKSSISSENSTMDIILRVTYKTLHKATDGFGKFSSVYEGILDQNGKLVAIKVLKVQVRGASKTFIAECEALRQIRHRNLVRFLTSCSSIDYQGNDFKALIYEFVANGNLDNWLHQSVDHEESEEHRSLTMLQRLNIVIDVACALDYLHYHCGSPLLHCDIKPSNVLLDEDFVAHFGDFGLAKFLPEARDMLFTSRTSSTIKGII
ncbi:probable LRR receptor-like serine/threonine-protein kinase At3g47570 [Lycium barbarum]|uniref:probable LRR receptor-like serine/threonine-protein kinase At3g47570 n=1 Tax=Lycium barbarum TaxID=112863 RepID=UPI00293E7682|nr:probable LRR receptor-like serine/threonine-protein kinase At3g47570 [Lycium barbarum]